MCICVYVCVLPLGKKRRDIGDKAFVKGAQDVVGGFNQCHSDLILQVRVPRMHVLPEEVVEFAVLLYIYVCVYVCINLPSYLCVCAYA